MVREKALDSGKLRIALFAAAALAAVAGLGWLGLQHWGGDTTADSAAPPAAPAENRFAGGAPITRADLDSLRWDEVDQLLQAVGGDPAARAQASQAAAEAETPPAIYVRAMLLLLDEQPGQAMAAFDSLDRHDLPPALLYPPHRLHQTLRPDESDPYLVDLREAVTAKTVAPLLRARVQARDGRLLDALDSYLRTDPRTWARYDIESLQRIADHQGLAPDVHRLISAALASGRVDKTLTPALDRMRGEAGSPAPPDAFEEQLRRELAEGTPTGRLALESAKRLLGDRQKFVARDYDGLLDAYSETIPANLATETVLLLFLSAVEAQRQVAVDRWGQELKRRHPEPEVRDWVNETAAMSPGAAP